MKSIRIYKDNIRQHILRSLFFTDTVLFGTGALFIAVLLFVIFKFGLHFFDWGYYLSTLIILEVFFMGLATIKIENQPIIKIAPRAFVHLFKIKKQKGADMDAYFTEFKIQDNIVVRRKSLVKIFKVEPYDISLLNDEDREFFFTRLKQVIHVLPSQVQLIVKKEKARFEDYSSHLFTLYKDSNKARESMVYSYAEDLSDLLKNNFFLTTNYYAVFSTPADSLNTKSFQTGIRRLNDISLRVSSGLSSCGIKMKEVENKDLISYFKSFLRS